MMIGKVGEYHAFVNRRAGVWVVKVFDTRCHHVDGYAGKSRHMAIKVAQKLLALWKDCDYMNA